MQMRWPVIVAAVGVALLPRVSSAVLEAPHDASFSDGACSRCHSLFVTTPSGSGDFNPGCVTCHDNTGPLSFGFPWLSDDQATPDVNGTHHSWSGYATNPGAGAVSPGSAALQSLLTDGRLQCVTCHDPHDAKSRSEPTQIHVSIDSPTDESGSSGVGGTAKMSAKAAGTAQPRGYRLLVVDNGGGAKGFIISHDFGLGAAATWYRFSGTWQPGTIAGPGYPITSGATDVQLDDPAVTVTFTTGAAVGDYWDFYVSFPFLRLSPVEDAICSACHRERFMNHVRARGQDSAYLPNGSRLFSHPVGVGLDANGFHEDQAEVVDASGVLQTANSGNGDGEKTNDLVMPTGKVRCTTCHAVHNADSNSLTKDAR